MKLLEIANSPLKPGDRVSTKYGSGNVVAVNGQTVTVQLGDETQRVIAVGEVRAARSASIAKRDPSWEALQAKRRSGAMGAHKNAKRELELGKVKHKLSGTDEY